MVKRWIVLFLGVFLISLSSAWNFEDLKNWNFETGVTGDIYNNYTNITSWTDTFSANYSTFLTHINWATAMNGTLLQSSQWNATNTSYVIKTGDAVTGDYNFSNGEITYKTTGLLDPKIVFLTTNTPNRVNLYLDESETENHVFLTGNGAALDTNLNIQCASGENALFSVGSSNTHKGSVLYSSGDVMRIRNHLALADIRFTTNNNVTSQIDVLTIRASTSSVGIGTIVPNNKLEVNGTLQITGNYTAVTCNIVNAGAIYYDNTTFTFYGCNSTTWRALY